MSEGAAGRHDGVGGARAARPTRSLRDLLGTEPPPGIAALPESDQLALAEIITAARRRQTTDLVHSFETTLKHVPFPLRGVIRKVLVG